jgi:electron transport complex protein RnfC
MKARAAEADSSPEDRARTQLEKLRQRLQKSEQRLAEGQAAGEDDKILEALAASVDRLKAKIAEAEAELTAAEDA